MTGPERFRQAYGSDPGMMPPAASATGAAPRLRQYSKDLHEYHGVRMRGPDVSGFREEVPLAGYTTIGIGGPARYFCEPATAAELERAVVWARERGQPFLILGGGSNLLLPDEGYAGLVVRPRLLGEESELRGEEARVRVAAGEDWDAFVAAAVARDWAGIECLAGIPGKVGAAPIQNIGAYGQEIATVTEAVEVLDLESLRRETLTAKACAFSYRNSLFKGRAAGRYAVLALRLKLRIGGAATIRYPDLQQRLTAEAGLAQVRQTVLAVRREKSMVLDPADPNARSCGSFFTNPILGEAAYRTFAERAPADHPRFQAERGRMKLSAAWLMERAGFGKGYGRGAAGLSSRHCLAIINRGGASAADVRELMREIQTGVYRVFGVRLTPEPLIVPAPAPAA